MACLLLKESSNWVNITSAYIDFERDPTSPMTDTRIEIGSGEVKAMNYIIKETIFIVDGTPANLGVLFDQLEAEGFKVLIDTNGESAIEAIRQAQPDLILLDVKIPGMDGFEVCARLKADERTRDIPVIFMTALSEVVNEVKGLKLGAVDYITKPIRVEAMVARIYTHLSLRNQQKTLEDRNAQLQEALDSIKTLKGWLEICANCKKIRDDQGYWHQFETYIEAHSDVSFTHGICLKCIETLYGEQEWYKKAKKQE